MIEEKQYKILQNKLISRNIYQITTLLINGATGFTLWCNQVCCYCTIPLSTKLHHVHWILSTIEWPTASLSTVLHHETVIAPSTKMLTTPACLKYRFVLWLAWIKLCPPLKTAIISIPRENISLDTPHSDLCWISGAENSGKFFLQKNLFLWSASWAHFLGCCLRQVALVQNGLRKQF